MQLAFYSLREYIQRKISEKKKLINFQKIKGIGERQALIIKWLYEEPDLLFSVKEIETRFNIANQTARTDLTLLVNMGYLDIVELNKKARGFCRSTIFEQLIKNNLPDTDGF